MLKSAVGRVIRQRRHYTNSGSNSTAERKGEFPYEAFKQRPYRYRRWILANGKVGYPSPALNLPPKRPPRLRRQKRGMSGAGRDKWCRNPRTILSLCSSGSCYCIIGTGAQRTVHSRWRWRRGSSDPRRPLCLCLPSRNRHSIGLECDAADRRDTLAASDLPCVLFVICLDVLDDRIESWIWVARLGGR